MLKYLEDTDDASTIPAAWSFPTTPSIAVNIPTKAIIPIDIIRQVIMVRVKFAPIERKASSMFSMIFNLPEFFTFCVSLETYRPSTTVVYKNNQTIWKILDMTVKWTIFLIGYLKMAQK